MHVRYKRVSLRRSDSGAERLDLDHAIYTCLANARSPQERREQARDPARDRVQVFEPDGWPDRIRQYYD